MLGRPEGWVCRRCTEWWNWHPYRPPTEQELDVPCAECRKTMDAEERAVEVNRLLLARLSAGSGPLALPIPTALTDRQPQPHPASTQSTPEFSCTVKEAGAMLGCGTTKVYELLNEGRLQAAEKFGRKRMVLKSSVEALLKAGGISAPPPQPRKPAPDKPRAKDAKSLAAAITKLPVK
jgi:excisionase family DNA binding protein